MVEECSKFTTEIQGDYGTLGANDFDQDAGNRIIKF